MQVNKRGEVRLLQMPSTEVVATLGTLLLSVGKSCGPESSHNTPVCGCLRQVALNGPELAGEKQFSETHKVNCGNSLNRTKEPFSRTEHGCDILYTSASETLGFCLVL